MVESRGGRQEIEKDQESHDYVVLWRHYDGGEREWDRYHLMTRASAEIILLSVPMYEPHCKRAKICTMESEEELELGDYPWSAS